MSSRLVLSVAILAVLVLGFILVPAKPVAADTVCVAEADGCTWTCYISDGFGSRRKTFNLCQ